MKFNIEMLSVPLSLLVQSFGVILELALSGHTVAQGKPLLYDDGIEAEQGQNDTIPDIVVMIKNEQFYYLFSKQTKTLP